MTSDFKVEGLQAIVILNTALSMSGGRFLSVQVGRSSEMGNVLGFFQKIFITTFERPPKYHFLTKTEHWTGTFKIHLELTI